MLQIITETRIAQFVIFAYCFVMRMFNLVEA